MEKNSMKSIKTITRTIKTQKINETSDDDLSLSLGIRKSTQSTGFLQTETKPEIKTIGTPYKLPNLSAPKVLKSLLRDDQYNEDEGLPLKTKSVREEHGNPSQVPITGGNIKTGWVNVNLVPTKFIQFGLKEYVTLGGRSNFDGFKAVIIVIPGFFGSIDLYLEFMKQLYEKTAIPVIGISHGGHCKPPHDPHGMKFKSLEKNPWLYDMTGQITHKLVFIHHYIPSSLLIIPVAHCVGAYIALQMLELQPKNKYGRCILILPVMEHFEALPVGDQFKNWVKISHMKTFIAAAKFTQYIPVFLLKFLSDLTLSTTKSLPRSSFSGLSDVLCPKVLKITTHLISSALEIMHAADFDALEANQKLLSVYYSDVDTWTPPQFGQRLRKFYPESDIKVCWDDIEHLFYFSENGTKKVAETVAEVIIKKVRDNWRLFEEQTYLKPKNNNHKSSTPSGHSISKIL